MSSQAAIEGGTNMAAQGDVPHNDYRAGFIVGFQAIAGTRRAIPSIPAQPTTKTLWQTLAPGVAWPNMTPFLMGVRKGIERAGGSLSS
jgi:hypothetical protein